MPENESVEEQYMFSKSSATSFVVGAMCYEFILAQQAKTNRFDNVTFLNNLEEIAKETIAVFQLPEKKQDLIQLMDEFSKRALERICRK